jgi:hypothetical protein
MQETSDLISEGLTRKVTGQGKRTRNQLDNAPDGLPDNEMAPPAKSKRQRVNKVLFQSLSFAILNILSRPRVQQP